MLSGIADNGKDNETDKGLANGGIFNHAGNVIHEKFGTESHKAGRDKQQDHSGCTRHGLLAVFLLILADGVSLVDDKDTRAMQRFGTHSTRRVRRSRSTTLRPAESLGQGVGAAQANAGSGNGQRNGMRARGMCLRLRRKDRVREQIRQWGAKRVQSTCEWSLRTIGSGGGVDGLDLRGKVHTRLGLG